MGFFSKLFKKPDWKMVKTIKIAIHDTFNPSDEGFAYYHLYESEYGKRRVEFASTMKVRDVSAMCKRLEDYQDIVLPWLSGRYVKGIPSYSDVDGLDVINRLS